MTKNILVLVFSFMYLVLVDAMDRSLDYNGQNQKNSQHFGQLFCWFLGNLVPKSKKLIAIIKKASTSNSKYHAIKCFCPKKLVLKSFLNALFYISRSLLPVWFFSCLLAWLSQLNFFWQNLHENAFNHSIYIRDSKLSKASCQSALLNWFKLVLGRATNLIMCKISFLSFTLRLHF